ncbi:ABC transporter permease [Streptococcus suis]|uniref:ABC transporter permease n=1 Tax=Streptococcus suis TaxID=1307 RepID=UPI0003F7A72A|nr:ABC transporter permease [Streptococcus suis]
MFLAIEEMRQNKLRYGLILGLLILISYLVFFLTGLAYGLMQENRTAVDKWQADYVLLNSESNRLITASKIDTALLDQVDAGDKALIRQQAGVAYVDENATSDEKEKVNIFAVESDSFIIPNIVEGRLYEKTGEVVVDKTLSEVEGFGLGDQIYLSGSDKKVTIVGYTDNAYFGVAPVVYMDFTVFADLMQADKQQAATSNLASAIVVRGDVASVPDELEKVAIADFIENLPGYKAQNMIFGFMIGFLIVISAIVIGIFIFVLTTQKSPIFGLMKIQGLSNGYISGSVLAQTFLLAGLGTVLGLAGTYLSSLVLPSAVPFENNWTFYIVIGLALVVFALLGASFSVRSIFKVDPLRNLS